MQIIFAMKMSRSTVLCMVIAHFSTAIVAMPSYVTPMYVVQASGTFFSILYNVYSTTYKS